MGKGIEDASKSGGQTLFRLALKISPLNIMDQVYGEINCMFISVVIDSD